MQKLRLSLKQDLADRLRLLGGDRDPPTRCAWLCQHSRYYCVHLCGKFTFACPHHCSTLHTINLVQRVRKRFIFHSSPCGHFIILFVSQWFKHFLFSSDLKGSAFDLIWYQTDCLGALWEIMNHTAGRLRTNSHTILIPFCVVDLLPAREV